MKDFLICASRGRDPDNPSDRTPGKKLKQRLEINNDGICNTLSTVLKDNYVIEVERNNIDFDNLTRSKWVNDKYKNFYENKGYLPRYFEVYNALEITDIAPAISTRSNGAMGSGTLLIIEEADK